MGEYRWSNEYVDQKRKSHLLHTLKKAVNQDSVEFLIVDDYTSQKSNFPEKIEGFDSHNYNHDGKTMGSRCIMSSQYKVSEYSLPLNFIFYLGSDFIGRNKRQLKTNMNMQCCLLTNFYHQRILLTCSCLVYRRVVERSFCMTKENIVENKDDTMTIQSVKRALGILSLFDHDSTNLTFTEILQETDLPKTTAFRMLNTLVESDFLRYDNSTNKYTLGSQIIYLGCVAMGATKLVNVALPIMENLRDITGQTITLYIRKGKEKVCIQRVESIEDIRLTVTVGRYLPIYVGASGLVLLSGVDEEQLDKFINSLEIIPLTPCTIVDKTRLKEAITNVKIKGYCISRNERQMGAAGIGAPIFDQFNRVIASLNISGLAEKFEENKIPGWISLVKEAAYEISCKLGYRE